jgi:glutamate N-acetyltransferase/amino-acid N-acetyltransferase
VKVEGAPSEAGALAVARRIAASPLVKTALHGADPNWGRIVAAAGMAGVTFTPGRVELHFEDVQVVRAGLGLPEAEAAAHEIMRRPAYAIRLHLHAGRGRAEVTTCDLGHPYVDVNADYRS